MCRARLAFIFFAVAAIILANSSLVFAQATRTWVSGVGDDANPCSRTAPCKTWAGAISKTSTYGEIDALDPGGFGAVTITKSITLDGGGSLAGVLVSGTNGVTVAAGATDVVVLRGLQFDGLNTGLSGVGFVSGGALYVEKCNIFGFTSSGISFTPDATSQLFVSGTKIETNTSGAPGISLQPSGTGKAYAAIDKSLIEDNAIGLIAGNNVQAVVSNSVISGNSQSAISVTGDSVVTVENCILSNNTGAGVFVNSANAKVLLNNNTVANNGSGLSYGASKGSIISFKNNAIVNNSGENGAPTSSTTLK